MNRFFVACAGLVGAAGVILAAANAHPGEVVISSDANLSDTASTILMVHAPAFLAIGAAAGKNRLLAIGGGVLLVGLVLFCGELIVHIYADIETLALAAPIGGAFLILGWLMIGAAAIFFRSDGAG